MDGALRGSADSVHIRQQRNIALLLLALLFACAPTHGPAEQRDPDEPYPSPSLTQGASEIEDILFTLLNDERASHGSPRLSPDPQLQKIARGHSLHMARRRELSHVNSSGEGPTERAERAGIRTVKRTGSSYRIGIVENVGHMPVGNVKGHGVINSPRDVALAMKNEWMRSRSHRANILNSDVTHMGIGAAPDGRGNFYLTLDMR